MATMPLNPSMGGQQIPFGGSTGPITNTPGSGSGTVPMTPVTNPNQGPVMNPYASPGATPTGSPMGGAIPAGAPAGSVAPGTNPSGLQSNGVNWNDGSYTITGDLKDTYGSGTGQAISSVLQNMGTVNDSAVQATINNTDLAANQQYSNIQAQEAGAGITPNSSTVALAAGDFYSNVNSQLQQTIGQEEVGQENTLLSTLTNTGAAHGPDVSTFDSIMSDIGSIF